MGLVTLEEVKDEIGMEQDVTQFDNFLNRKIEAISTQIEDYCARSFIEQAITNERWDYPIGVIMLKQFPVDSIQEVRVDGTAITADEYHLDEETGRLWYKSDTQIQNWEASDVEEYVEVDYTAGYATLPADLKDAVLALVRKAYLGRKGDPSVNVKFESVPNAISTAYFDPAKEHPLFGNFIEVIALYR